MTTEYDLPPLPEPVTYAHFADNGLIRMWSKERTNLQAVTDAIGKQPSALITSDQAQAYAIAAIESALKSQVKEDAERYLWLKDQCKKSTGGLVVCRVKNWELEPWSCDHLDQDIDRARSAKGDLK